MKIFLISTLLCSAIALPARGELTDADLDKIRLIVKEELQQELKPIKADVEALKINVARLEGRFTGIDGRFTGMEGRFTSIENQIAHATNLTYGLIALIVAAVGIPLYIMTWRSRRDSTLERRLEEMAQELETLKQQRIVNP